MSQLGQDRAPFSLVRFDAHGFADELRDRFGEDDNSPFVIDVCDFTGHRANWIILSASQATAVAIRELHRMCRDRGLHLYSE